MQTQELGVESGIVTRLVTKCLAGDSSAWDALVRRYARLVHSVPVRHGLTPMEVDDIGQEVFLALAQNLHQIEDPERLGAWLVTTARRLCWRALSKRRAEDVEDGATDERHDGTEESIPANQPLLGRRMPGMSELLNGWARQEMLAMGLARLGTRCRDLLALVFLDPDEPSYETIAERLSIPKGSIGPTRNRCLEQLRSILEGLGFHQQDG